MLAMVFLFNNAAHRRPSPPPWLPSPSLPSLPPWLHRRLSGKKNMTVLRTIVSTNGQIVDDSSDLKSYLKKKKSVPLKIQLDTKVKAKIESASSLVAIAIATVVSYLVAIADFQIVLGSVLSIGLMPRGSFQQHLTSQQKGFCGLDKEEVIDGICRIKCTN